MGDYFENTFATGSCRVQVKQFLRLPRKLFCMKNTFTHLLNIDNWKVLQVKVIFAVVKQLKQLQRKPRKESEAPTGKGPFPQEISRALMSV